MNEHLVRMLGFGIAVERVKHSFCAVCAEPIVKEEFTDVVSRREHEISGMCQKVSRQFFRQW